MQCGWCNPKGHHEKPEFQRPSIGTLKLLFLHSHCRGHWFDPSIAHSSVCFVVGDLSLVGPRPLLVRYLDRYSPEQNRRHDVRPGITGWAQVNGRNLLSWEEKFAFDVWYVDHWSLWLDLKILFITFAKVLKCSGGSAARHATMPEFMGTEESLDKNTEDDL